MKKKDILCKIDTRLKFDFIEYKHVAQYPKNCYNLHILLYGFLIKFESWCNLMHISKSIIVNIGEDKVISFLKKQGINTKDLTNGQNVENLIDDLLESGKLDEEAFDEFLFDELTFGKRNYLHIYNLDKHKKLIYEEDWLEPLKKYFEVTSLQFNEIVYSIPNHNCPRKIAAIHTEYNGKREISKIIILFTYYITLKAGGDSCCYIPVEFDLDNKKVVIKAWRRQGISDFDEYKFGYIMDNTMEWFKTNFNLSIKKSNMKYKKILYNMTAGLVNELICDIPSYTCASNLEHEIDSFSNSVIGKMNLENKETTKDGKYCLAKGIMDINNELNKLLIRLSVSDYFHTREFTEVWDMDISAVINSVKFNNSENILAIVKAENNNKPVFCSKPFLVLLDSIEERKAVNTITISFIYTKKMLRVNYDASDSECFKIGVLDSPNNFDISMFDKIWEVLSSYDQTNYRTFKKMDTAITC